MTSYPLSCEFFPPHDEAGYSRLQRVMGQLSQLNPQYFSVTYGAGGSTQQRTLSAVEMVHQQYQSVAACPHLTCIGANRDQLAHLLTHYQTQGINRVVALRGDRPSGIHSSSELPHAADLVHFIRQHSGDYFHIEIAAYPEMHPQADSFKQDLNHFIAKANAGANGAITQYFFNADAYLRFRDDCQQHGVELAIVPGIMPITNYRQLARFSDGCGAEIPRWIRQRLVDYQDDKESLQAFGVDVISQLCHSLLQQEAPGLHFYSMNRAKPVTQIVNNLQQMGWNPAPNSPKAPLTVAASAD